jgi:iron complex transport system substrate-binding protein
MKRLLPVCALLLVLGWLALDRFEPSSAPGASPSSSDTRPKTADKESASSADSGDRPRGTARDLPAAAGFALRELGVPGGWRELRPLGPGARPLVLAETPRRIVSQALVTDEILLALGVGERLVAVSRPAREARFSMVVEEAARVSETVGGSAEQILALRPDVVFLAAYTTPEALRQLALARAPAIRLDRFDSLDAVRGNVVVVGFAVGRDGAASALVEAMDRRLAEARARARRSLGERSPRVLAWEDGAVPAAQTIFDDVVRELGASNVAADAGLAGWPRVGVENIASWDPDLLFVPADAGERSAVLAYLRAQPGLGETRAVRTGAVATVPRAAFSTVSHHVASLAESLAESLAIWVEGEAPRG